jgi:hypothetical protein
LNLQKLKNIFFPYIYIYIYIYIFINLKQINTNLGERYIEECLETTYHNIISIYDILLLLKQNNTVHDLTNCELYSGNDNFDNFLYDIQLINKADLNIVLGHGGTYCLCNAFSKHNIFYIPPELILECDTIKKFNKLNKNTCDDTYQFIFYIIEDVKVI